MTDQPTDPEPRPFPDEGPLTVTVEEEIAELVPHFLENRRENVETLRAALEDGDAETVGALGHRMKGIGGGYGFEYVSTAGAAIEDAARGGRLDDAGPWIEGLAEYLDRVVVEVGTGD